jgi:hypothetical protein
VALSAGTDIMEPMTSPRLTTGKTWVEGGPLIVVPESQLPRWGGGITDESPGVPGDDYERACSVRGLIGLLDVGERQALVLGDEPAMTTYLPEEQLFLRWAAAESDVELIAAARKALREGVQWDDDEDLTWDIREPVVLCEAVWPGTKIEADNHLVIDIQPGRHRVRATYLTDDSNWMFLIQLQPIPAAGGPVIASTATPLI